MDAKSAEKYVNNLNLANFGGIFTADQLKNVKIMSYPCSLLIFHEDHWLSAYLTEKKIEIMDSAGELTNDNLNMNLVQLLCPHIHDRKFFSTPKLQNNQSNKCGMFAIFFLYYRSVTHRSLCDLCKLFTENLSSNEMKIFDLFKFITE